MMSKILIVLLISIMMIITVTSNYIDESHDHDHHEHDLGGHKHHAGCAFHRSRIDTMQHEREFQALLKHHNLDKINPRSLIGTFIITVHHMLMIEMIT